MADAAASRALTTRHGQWSHRLPQVEDDFWAWCLDTAPETLLTLLAYCTACSLDAVRRPHDQGDARIVHADQLATALSLDMSDWWDPTVGNYLGRVSREHVLKAVGEGISPQAADNLRKLKKDALIAHAEERLAGTGWLPAVLCSPIPAAAKQPALAAE